MGSFRYGRVHSSTNTIKITFLFYTFGGSKSWTDGIGQARSFQKTQILEKRLYLTLDRTLTTPNIIDTRYVLNKGPRLERKCKIAKTIK